MRRAVRVVGAVVLVAVGLAWSPPSASAQVITPPAPPPIVTPTPTPVAPPTDPSVITDGGGGWWGSDDPCDGPLGFLGELVGSCSDLLPGGDSGGGGWGDLIVPPPTDAISPPFSGDQTSTDFGGIADFRALLLADGWTQIAEGEVAATGQLIGQGDQDYVGFVQVPSTGWATVLSGHDTDRRVRVLIHADGRMRWETNFRNDNFAKNGTSVEGAIGGAPGDWLFFRTDGNGLRVGTHYVSVDNKSSGWNNDDVLGTFVGDGVAKFATVSGAVEAAASTAVAWLFSHDNSEAVTCWSCIESFAALVTATEIATGDGWQDRFEADFKNWKQWIGDLIDQLPTVSDSPAPTPTSTPTPTSIPEFDPEPDPGDGGASQGTDIALGNRIGDFFRAQTTAIGGAIGWLGDFISGLFGWLISELWSMFRWLGELLRELFDTLIAATLVIRDALINLAGFLYGSLMTMLERLGAIITLLNRFLTSILAGIVALVNLLTSVPSLLWQMLQWVGQLPNILLSLPQLIIDGFEGLIRWVFIPDGPWIPDTGDEEPPLVTIVQDIGPAISVIVDSADMSASCGPSLDVTMPEVLGHQGSLVWNAPNPAVAGCPGNGPGGAYTSTDAAVGDLFGYRSAFRAALAIAVGIWFVMSAYRMVAPWEKSEDAPVDLAGDGGAR